ncbi:MAG TPA: thiol reductant ABC exporter subunit CydC [Actinomycetota bacterium]|nr:thiol reductant ABC exporter subunit CydC [Actinomycetota bacterium]
MTSRGARRAFALLAPQRARIALAVAAGSAAALCTIGLMAASGLLISRAALRPAVLDLMVLVAVVRLLAIGRGSFRYLERLASHDAALRSLGGIRTWFFRRLEPLAPGGLGGERTGDLLGRFAGDVDSLQSLIVRGVVPVAVAVVSAVASVALAWLVLPVGAAVLAVLALLAGGAAPWLALRLESVEERTLAEARGELAADVADLLDGVQEIVAFGRQDEWLGRLDRAEAALEAAERHAAWRKGLREGLGLLVWGLAPPAMLAVGIPAVRSGRLPGVDLGALVLLGWATLEVLRSVPAAVDSLRADLRTAGRLFDLADRQPPVVDPPNTLPAPGPGPILVEHLRVRYGPGLPLAADGLGLAVEPGGVVALVGPSGAGKTTVAQTLVRFCGIESGSVVVDGHDVAGYAQDGVRALVGLLAQDAYVFNTTIGANIRLARPEAADEELDEACRKAGLSAWLAALPLGLETPAGNDGALVSGGERQRIALARTLLAGRGVLVLDEPTANLDPETGRRVIDEILAAASGATVVLITHDLAAAAKADAIVVVDRGRTVERGTHGDLLAAGGRYARMWGLPADVDGGGA